jgi:hypothetical protein
VQKQKQKQKQKIKLIKMTKEREKIKLSRFTSTLSYLLNHTFKTQTLSLTFTTFAEFNRSIDQSLSSLNRSLADAYFPFTTAYPSCGTPKKRGGGAGQAMPHSKPDQTNPELRSRW